MWRQVSRRAVQDLLTSSRCFFGQETSLQVIYLPVRNPLWDLIKIHHLIPVSFRSYFDGILGRAGFITKLHTLCSQQMQQCLSNITKELSYYARSYWPLRKMVPRGNKNNAYAKFGGTNREYYGIFRTVLLVKNHWFIMPANSYLYPRLICVI